MLFEIDRRPPAFQPDPAFRAAMLDGFSRSPKATSPAWFYDRRGSELFEEITRLPEYYPTRIETGLLEAYCGEVGKLTGPRRAVVEFGAGSATKTPHLLSAIDPSAYVPVDISGDFLRASATGLSQRFPGLPVLPVEADFTHPVSLPASIAGMPKLGFFPGSTIGNMEPREAVDLLRAMAASLGRDAMLLIGIDRIKDIDRLIRAYDDAAGVTAAFNLNLLARINRELAGTLPIDAFAHRALWNDKAARIEMHLEARRDMRFEIAGAPFAMAEGETIHTENSHKYGVRDGRLLLRAGGWEPLREWTDSEGLFSITLATLA